MRNGEFSDNNVQLTQDAAFAQVPSKARTMQTREERTLFDGIELLRKRLPTGWHVEFEPESSERARRNAGLERRIDGYIRIDAPDRKSVKVALESKRRVEPREAIDWANQLRSLPKQAPWLLIAPYLSPATREQLRKASLAFLDLTGNIRIDLREPGLFIETQGANKNPDTEERPAISLRGSKAGQIVRTLLTAKEPPGVRELAEHAGIDPGYVSRVFALLDREAIVDRRDRGKIARVDRIRLLRRWAEDAPLSSRGRQETCLEPRGLPELLAHLKLLGARYAITGSLAAAEIAPIAASRLATLYVDNIERAVDLLKLRPAELGGNVVLIEPNDPSVFADTVAKDGLVFVSPLQAAADLMTSPGRGPAEAEELIAWMSKNDETWRG